MRLYIFCTLLRAFTLRSFLLKIFGTTVCFNSFPLNLLFTSIASNIKIAAVRQTFQVFLRTGLTLEGFLSFYSISNKIYVVFHRHFEKQLSSAFLVLVGIVVSLAHSFTTDINSGTSFSLLQRCYWHVL